MTIREKTLELMLVLSLFMSVIFRVSTIPDAMFIFVMIEILIHNERICRLEKK